MKITFREIHKSDLDFIRKHRNNPDTQQWLETQQFITEKMQADWFSAGGADVFRIIQADGTDIGLARLKLIKEEGKCSIGLDIFSEYQGRGLAEKAFSNLMLEGLKLAPKLDLWVFVDNLRAIKTYLKCGFEYDCSTEVKHYPRILNGRVGIYPYVHMIYEPSI